MLQTRFSYLNNTESGYSDPLLILLGCGRSCNPGPWIGDIVGVSIEIPEGYALLK